MSDLRTDERIEADLHDWGPLEDLVGYELADEFMWMFRVALEDGRHLHAYKHIATRAYLHIAEDRRVYVFVPEHSYREVEPRWAIAMAFRGWEELQPQPVDPDHVREELSRLTRLPENEDDEPILARRLIRGMPE